MGENLSRGILNRFWNLQTMVMTFHTASNRPRQHGLEEFLVLPHPDLQIFVELYERIGAEIVVEGNVQIPTPVSAIRGVEAQTVIRLEPKLMGWSELTVVFVYIPSITVL
jgi:hypothetical protein